MLRFLLKSKANLEQKWKGLTPVEHAVASHHHLPGAVQVFLDFGAKISETNQITCNWATDLATARINARHSIVVFLGVLRLKRSPLVPALCGRDLFRIVGEMLWTTRFDPEWI